MRHLPRESALVREVVGEPADWGVAEYLLAHAVDGVNNLIYAYVASHTKGHTPKPKPVPRPDLTEVRRAQRQAARPPNQPPSTTAEIAAFFGASSVRSVGGE